MLLLPLLLATDSGPVYSGRAHQLHVAIPRLEATAVVDGVLDEPVWAQAARLTGFSQYQPSDGQPAAEATEVLVWYAPDAIWFGIRAHEAHGDVVRATQANRDNIGSEDQIQILLDTYNDHRLAYLFGVNPLGVQQDGTRSDLFNGGAGGTSATGGGVGISILDGNVDLNPDYIFESKGHLTPGGYEVEVRIPFSSLRYQGGATQTWGLNILRRIQHTGFQDSWAPALRANASFLVQSGTLEGLHDLRRGLVLEATPTVTSHFDGAPSASTGNWGYSGTTALGGDLRWGLSQNLTLNGTVNPDFSQVEADVGQVLINERFALFYPEKRPFFLEGLERFDTPNQLIYTRRIVDPDFGFKLAGKQAGTTIGALIAQDGPDQSATGSRPDLAIVRLRHDLGANSTIGFVGTDREDGSQFNRVFGFDGRIYHSKLYFIELQAVQSWTRGDSGTVSGPLLEAVWDRTGRNWGFHYTLKGVAPDFNAALGFVNRVGIFNFDTHNRLTGYGGPNALVQTYGAFFGFGRYWNYSSFKGGPFEGAESISPYATLRGGWNLNGSLGRNFYSFDPAAFSGYKIQQTNGGVTDTAAFTVPGMESNLWSGSLGVTTPTWRAMTASVSAGVGEVPIFSEAVPGTQYQWTAALDLRPTNSLRLSFQATDRIIDRQRDGSRFSRETIPRLKVEYQLSRAIFVRFVGQYTAQDGAAFADAAGNPILIQDTSGTYVIVAPSSSNEFRMDWLFSYRPTPGTLIYLGYGSTLDEPQPFQFRHLDRTTDGFFGKVSWLFRL